MNKLFKLLVSLILVLSLSACFSVKTYDDLMLEYQNHILSQEAIYQAQIDYFNYLSTESVKSVVSVKKTSTFSGTTTGSGVIYKEDAFYYYALTNNHVVYTSTGTRATYTVSDYLGNEYNASFIASNGSYDLAVVRFRKTVTLRVIEFADENPDNDEKIAVIGYPSFQINAITLGIVIDYAKIEIESSSNSVIDVNFDVLVSDAPVKSGSSGSVVLDEAFKLVGIIYAGNFSNDSDTSTFAFAIPLVRVIEFLNSIGENIGGAS
jgi:S1-C subfamily serine protease